MIAVNSLAGVGCAAVRQFAQVVSGGSLKEHQGARHLTSNHVLSVCSSGDAAIRTFCDEERKSAMPARSLTGLPFVCYAREFGSPRVMNGTYK